MMPASSVVPGALLVAPLIAFVAAAPAVGQTPGQTPAPLPARAQEDDPPPPTWEVLNARPTPEWFDQARFGIFVHWGVYSVPAFSDTSTYSEWYPWWVKTGAHDGLERRFHEENYGADFEYREFAPRFRAELFDAGEWAAIFARAGARYVVGARRSKGGEALQVRAGAEG